MEATKMWAPVGRADGRGMQVDASERAQQMGAVSVDPIPHPPDIRREVPTMGRRGWSCEWVVHEPLHVGL